MAGAAGDEQSAPEASRADQGASPPVQPRGDGLSTAYLQTPASQQATGAESVNVRFSARSPAEDLQSTGGAAEETPAVPSAVQSAPEPSLEIVPVSDENLQCTFLMPSLYGSEPQHGSFNIL